jgi:hypothetical protein
MVTQTEYKWTWATEDFYMKTENGQIERVTGKDVIPHHLIPFIVANAGTWVTA